MLLLVNGCLPPLASSHAIGLSAGLLQFAKTIVTPTQIKSKLETTGLKVSGRDVSVGPIEGTCKLKIIVTVSPMSDDNLLDLLASNCDSKARIERSETAGHGNPNGAQEFEIDLPVEVVMDGGFCDPLGDKSSRFFGVVMQPKRKMKQIELIASERTLERRAISSCRHRSGDFAPLRSQDAVHHFSRRGGDLPPSVQQFATARACEPQPTTCKTTRSLWLLRRLKHSKV